MQNRKVILVLVLLIAFLAADTAPLYDSAIKPTDNTDGINVFKPSVSSAAEERGNREYCDAVTEITAVESSADGIEADSDFILTCARVLDEKKLSDFISVSPLKTYTISRKADKKYLLAFDEPLESNSVVNFTLNSSEKPRSWAFQTKKELSIIHSFPFAGSTGVPANTGIEVELSHLETVNFEKCFKIEPAVNGRIENHGKTWVFVPDSLQLDTLYTVTISKDLMTAGGETLGKDHVFSFRTELTYPNDRSHLFIQGNAWETFLPDAIPVVEIGASEHFNDTDFDVKVYKYADDRDYIEALRDRSSYIKEQLGYACNYFAQTAGLEPVSETSLKINRISENDTWSPCYLVLPDKLPEGYYLIDINAVNSKAKCGSHIQKFVQIHPYAVYSLSVNGSQLVWVNDTVSGAPISGAKVSIDDKSALTDANGLAQIETPNTKQNSFSAITVTSGILPFASPLYLEPENDDQRINEQFYTYIYTDRERYQPTDTVKIWGIILSKDGRSVPPKEAELRFAIGYRDMTPITKKVDLDDAGAFSGEVSFSGLTSDYYTIELAAGDTVYCSKSVNVGEYVKPSYVIVPSLDKPVSFAWDSIPLSVKVSFFDGTPAANTDLNIYESRIQKNTVITSSADGTIQKNLGYVDNDNSWYPQYCYYNVSTAGAEDVLVENYGHYYVVPRDTMVKTTYEQHEDKYTLTIMTNKIVLESVSDESDITKNNYENITGPATDIPVKVSIYKVTWSKTQIGTYYDFINKVTYPKYEYTKSEEQVNTLSGTTSQGVIAFNDLNYKLTKDEYYYAVVECTDTRGKPIQQEVYLGYNYDYRSNSGIKRFRFGFDGMNGKNPEFSVNETAEIRLQDDWDWWNEQAGRPFEGSGKILYAVVQNGLMRFGTADKPSFDFTFLKQDIPNVQIYGAYFDGKNIFPVDCARIYYDPSEMELTVDAAPDKERYSPGEKVELDVLVTDKDKNPIRKAAVCVSVVDEAAFAVENQTADPLKEMYSRYFYSSCRAFSSYTQHDFSGYPMAEGGGEGGSAGIRKNFLDTASFMTAMTDENGRAHFGFKLPDNLTSWRVTSLAVSDGVYAGKSKINTVTTLPMFADLLVNRVYLKGDDLSASARAFGTALGSSEEVSFSAVLLSSDGTKKTLSGSGTPGSYVNFNFGSGPEGLYTLTVTAKSKSGTDGIEKSFRVVNSALEIPIIKAFSLADGIDITALRSPVTIALFDPSRALYNSCLMQLASEYGSRADIRVSRVIAQEMMKDIFGNDLPYYFYGMQTESIEPGSLQDYTGGVRILDYSEPETELTAKLCAAAPEYLNTDSAANYMNSVIENNKAQSEDVAAAYMGLAALKKPVLLDIQYLLAKDDLLGLKEKLYLTAGLALIGDLTSASVAFDDIVVPLLESDYYGSFVNTGNKDQNFECTALAALTAIKTGKTITDSLMNYVLKSPSDEITACMECLFYVLHNPKQTGESISFSYLSSGKRETVTISDYKAFVLSMTADELKKADFRTESGEVAVLASYIGSAEDIEDPAAEGITLHKTIESVDGKPIIQSSLIKITITPIFNANAPIGWYELSDYIPSGARYAYSKRASWRDNWWLQNVEGQKITFTVKNPEAKDFMDRMPITYFVRAVAAGQYVVDSAYIKSTETAAWGMSEKDEMQINEK